MALAMQKKQTKPNKTKINLLACLYLLRGWTKIKTSVSFPFSRSLGIAPTDIREPLFTFGYKTTFVFIYIYL